MAVATSELHGLLVRVDNDNWPIESRKDRSFKRAHPLHKDDFNVDWANLASSLDEQKGTLWARMKHRSRACYTPELVAESRRFQERIKQLSAGHEQELPFRFLVWSAESAGVFSLGGDLAFFTRCIRNRDEVALRRYAYACIDVLFDNYRALDLPILTVALVRGDAIGGGLESMVTNDITIAERGSKFGLPETLFNLFPGMGGYSFLRRRLGEVQARRIIEDGKSRSAEELHELGLIDVVCDTGQGERCLRDFLDANAGRVKTLLAMRRACKRVEPLMKQELIDNVDLWIDLAFSLSETELRRMDCLARVQHKKRHQG